MLEVAARPQTIDPREPQLPVRAIGREQAAAMGVCAFGSGPRRPIRAGRPIQRRRAVPTAEVGEKRIPFSPSFRQRWATTQCWPLFVRLRRGGQEWRGRPVVCEIVQPRLRVG